MHEKCLTRIKIGVGGSAGDLFEAQGADRQTGGVVDVASSAERAENIVFSSLDKSRRKIVIIFDQLPCSYIVWI